MRELVDQAPELTDERRPGSPPSSGRRFIVGELAEQAAELATTMEVREAAVQLSVALSSLFNACACVCEDVVSGTTRSRPVRR